MGDFQNTMIIMLELITIFLMGIFWELVCLLGVCSHALPKHEDHNKHEGNDHQYLDPARRVPAMRTGLRSPANDKGPDAGRCNDEDDPRSNRHRKPTTVT
jgi:hypothetical protein